MSNYEIASALYNVFRKYLGLTEIKKCVMEDFDDKCVSKIIKAHSISKSKGLREISTKVKNKIVVGRFIRKDLYDPIPLNQNIDVVYQDIKSASVFTGLCKYHDNILFRHIDKDPFNFNSEYNIFEYTLRNCVYSYYDRLSNLEGVVSRKKILYSKKHIDLTGTNDIYKSILSDKEALENDLNIFKSYLLNNEIENKLLYKLYIYNNNINITGNLRVIHNSEVFYITIIPSNKKSYILVSSLKGRNIFEKNHFFEYLRSFNQTNFELYLSRELLKVGSIRNYFFNYDVYTSLDDDTRRNIHRFLNYKHMDKFLGYDIPMDCPNFIELMTTSTNNKNLI